MGKTIRHNRNGKSYQDKDSAGLGYHTNITDWRGCTEYKSTNKLYGKYGKRAIRFAMCYANERDARSDRQKGYKHVESKSVRRGLQKEEREIIREELNNEEGII